MILGGVLGYTLSYLFENVGLALSTASEISLMMGVLLSLRDSSPPASPS